MKQDSRFKNYTLLGWIKYLYVRMTGKVIRVQGECKLCGRCCQRISLEANGRWIRKEAEFLTLVSLYPEYGRFKVVEKDRYGFLLFSCTWYTVDGICKDHAHRLSICKDFPHVSLYFSGGDMPLGCGYRFVVTKPFSKVLEEKMNNDR